MIERLIAFLVMVALVFGFALVTRGSPWHVEEPSLIGPLLPDAEVPAAEPPADAEERDEDHEEGDEDEEKADREKERKKPKGGHGKRGRS